MGKCVVSNAIKVYWEARLSLNFWSFKWGAVVPYYGAVSYSDSDTSLGFVIGSGLEYLVTSTIGVGADLRYNVVSVKSSDASNALITVLGNYHILKAPAAVTHKEEAPASAHKPTTKKKK